jgi:DNA-binding beta-propeller fold protein YncE
MDTSLAGRTLSSALAFLCSVGLFSLDAQNLPSLELSQKIALPGVEGRIDHLALDVSGERLFVCALYNNSVEVLDLRSGERIHSISGLGSPHGLVYVPELNRLFVASDRGGILRIYEAKSFQAIGELNFNDDADNVRYDDATKKIYVGFGGGGIAVVNGPDNNQVDTIKLSGHPEAFSLEKNGSRIFVNVPTSRHVAVIDREKGEVVASWKTDLAYGNFPMALDEAHHRLMIGCRTPSKLIVLNTDSGEIVAKVAISGDTDDLFYDSKRHRIYAICGSGVVDIIEQAHANNYKALSKVDTAEGARTGWFSPERDTLFVAVPHRGSQSAEIRAYRVE